MKRHTKEEKHAYRQQRSRNALNPCPGRTDTQRQYITRRLLSIVYELDYHLERVSPAQPRWLPEAIITPSSEANYLDARDSYIDTERDEHGYILCMHKQQQRATNRVRATAWFKNGDENLYMTAMIMVSPLPCEDWGALPLTLAQWRLLIPSMIATHLHWKWIHAVRKYWQDDSYQVGGTFGWHLETCKKLKTDDSPIWTGQAIYAHIVREFSEHAQDE